METKEPEVHGAETRVPGPTRRTTMRYVVGAALGGLVGYGYYRWVGCSTGACPLTSNPWISTLYGMLMGAMLAGGSR